GVLDVDDTFPLASVAGLTDTDADGEPNDCDQACLDAGMLADTDDDNDGVLDVNDMFPLNALESADTDADGIGNNADIDDDGDSIPDSLDAFPLDRSESLDSDGDGSGNNTDLDDDGDGIPDEVEIANQLDPLSSDDADLDADGDGVSNLEEYLQGTDIRVDDIGPQINLITPYEVDAFGRLTQVDLSHVTAMDAKDGVVEVTVDQNGPYTSGSHVLTWAASDSSGNQSTLEQQLEIRPLVRIQPNQQSGEGNDVSVFVALSGEAPKYPVTVNFTLGGTVDATDYAGLDNEFLIDAGTTGVVSFSIVSDTLREGIETLEITLLGSDEAALGHQINHTLFITEDNIPPQTQIVTTQSGEKRTTVYQQGGLVSLAAEAHDNNPGDVLRFDWSATSLELTLNASDQEVVTFDPSIVMAGSYRVLLMVSDDADVPGVVNRSQLLQIVAAAPNLSDEVDSDGDGLFDADEGAIDTDGDGIEDYLDTSTDLTILPLNNGDDNVVVETGVGLRLKLGEAARFGRTHGAAISDDNLSFLVGQLPGQPENPNDAQYNHPSGLFDFEIDQLPIAGQAVQVVLPLLRPIPKNAVYRKYSAKAGWQNFVENEANRLQSASNVMRSCPQSGSELYTQGLTPGHYCIQLTIVDGGLNDADREKNGVVHDPGGIAVFAPDLIPPELTVPLDLRLEAEDANGVPLGNDNIQNFLAGAQCKDAAEGILIIESVAKGGIDLTAANESIPIGITEVVFSCFDANQNLAEATSTITIADDTAPELTVGSDLVIISDAAILVSDRDVASLINAATCLDTVSGNLDVVDDAPSTFPLGVTTITFKCEDEALNQTSRSATVSVKAPEPPISNGSGDSGACFIATAAYGSYLDPHVLVLRDFRDSYLLTNRPGTQFVGWYYRISPEIAYIIAQERILRLITRLMLTPVIYAVVYPLESLLVLFCLLLFVSSYYLKTIRLKLSTGA
ncbi:MAG: hypothetical protein HON77_21495, partial [Gammaproteobacteria bacterium]|nr:hypothetical protein [Gammaproteobacteria bacterium]